MRAEQIRSTFLGFFTSRGHRLVPSSPLIPSDPTLLLANAGMNQFKPYFLGEVTPEFTRATSIQKCVRTSDIDNVGRTARHMTFFEMLGSFSFGGYFKAETIRYAYELMTAGYGLDPGRLWITVYLDDDEAAGHWRDAGIPGDRIQRLGMDDNYWSMGVPGPCGPCSDVCYDRGPAFGPGGGPGVNPERYLELWSLVFMQSLRGETGDAGGFPIVGDLPRKSIDTGLGMERLAAVLQDVRSVFETDVFGPTLAVVQELAGRRYPGDAAAKMSFEVVTEHARSIAFLIAGGVLPGREGRDYVLRRLMRHAIRHARLLGIGDHVLAPVTNSVVANLGGVWPELPAQASLIEQVCRAEEESFSAVLAHGTRRLTAAVDQARGSGQSVSGDTAFELHDTYGFPVELTLEAAHDAGLAVDTARFAELLKQQRARAKTGAAAKTGQALRRMDTYRQLSARHGRTVFTGYDELISEVTILGLISGGEITAMAGPGQQVEVVLDRSPFYAQSGGQVGDTGTLTTGDGCVLAVTDTRPGLEGFHVHTARVVAGEARRGQQAQAAVDAARRHAIARSHSATHVLHAMLRRTLGGHARQQGSLVGAGRLRFDFAHFAPVGQQQLTEIETLVNDHLLDDPEIRVWQASRAEADAAGAIASFGERYGGSVRVVDIGGFSRELCGGTHVAHGSSAGPVRLLGESSAGASLRRIEALTGRDALRYYDSEHALLAEVAEILGTRPAGAPQALRRRLGMLATAQAEIGRLREAELSASAAKLAGQAERAGDGWLVAQILPGRPANELRTLAAQSLPRLNAGPGIVILASSHEGSALLAAVVTPDLLDLGVEARQILAGAAKAIGGGAGGKGALASAGGRQTARLPHALALAAGEARSRIAQAR
jgi:alanyl-tRNA synthetase